MKVVYYCYGGAHSSVIASSIHVGMLPINRIPTAKEILAIPYFDITPNDKIGSLLYMGIDSWGNEIYCMGWGIYKNDILSLIFLLTNEEDNFIFDHTIFVDALPVANQWIKLGGLLSRRLGLVKIGRPLVIKGVQRRYFHFIKLVETVKAHNIRKQ
ncbi:Protein of unknown function [Garciella nitratireducens DSM 15102]|uniref:DUF3189 domain-containing protein n=1 Tax=Garciella nitratireducens DSM 15102 TaxID=1121911 RepID=A0A1T4K074_9FIRM|nr:DUF3189 family protein [Garciella nitratireducens]RBP39198.1 uncharacterized protein DUF3189 [Garciella nitratireducens]SJZ35779.1 Protein of unknown function [Garciella nitratireducens DSM 15102]